MISCFISLPSQANLSDSGEAGPFVRGRARKGPGTLYRYMGTSSISLRCLVILIWCLHVWNLYINFEFRSHLFFKRRCGDTWIPLYWKGNIRRLGDSFFYSMARWLGLSQRCVQSSNDNWAASMSKIARGCLDVRSSTWEIDAGYCHRGREWLEWETARGSTLQGP